MTDPTQPYEQAALNATLINRLDFIQSGRRTVRYHGLPMLDFQRIDAHSFGVAILTRILVPYATPERRARLMEAALYHDLAEWKTGDIPAPTKRVIPGLRDACQKYEDELMAPLGLVVDLDDRDSRVLKLADAAEGCLHCIYERYMGNSYIGPRGFYAFWSYLTEEQGIAGGVSSAWTTEAVAEWEEEGERPLRFYIGDQWSSANGGKW